MKSSEEYINNLKAFITPTHIQIIYSSLNEYFKVTNIQNIIKAKTKFSSRFFARHLNTDDKDTLYFYGYITLPEWSVLYKNFEFDYDEDKKLHAVNRLFNKVSKLRFKIYSDIERSKDSLTIEQDYIYENSNFKNKYAINLYTDSPLEWNVDDLTTLIDYVTSIKSLMLFFKNNIIPKLALQWKTDLDTFLNQ